MQREIFRVGATLKGRRYRRAPVLSKHRIRGFSGGVGVGWVWGGGG
eukprot:COSAG02_NODE_35560_length_466_cov_1.185286_1_plen_45_part_10